jgi:hypothetical protein
MVLQEQKMATGGLKLVRKSTIGQNIIGFIKKQRLNRLGHVERMAEDNIVQRIKRWKPMFKIPTGRPKTR